MEKRDTMHRHRRGDMANKHKDALDLIYNGDNSEQD